MVKKKLLYIFFNFKKKDYFGRSYRCPFHKPRLEGHCSREIQAGKDWSLKRKTTSLFRVKRSSSAWLTVSLSVFLWRGIGNRNKPRRVWRTKLPQLRSGSAEQFPISCSPSGPKAPNAPSCSAPRSAPRTCVLALTWPLLARLSPPAQLAPTVVPAWVDGAIAQQQQRVALPAGRLPHLGAARAGPYPAQLSPATPAEVHPARAPRRLPMSVRSASTGFQKLMGCVPISWNSEATWASPTLVSHFCWHRPQKRRPGAALP